MVRQTNLRIQRLNFVEGNTKMNRAEKFIVQLTQEREPTQFEVTSANAHPGKILLFILRTD
jgi:hypothetical protein